MKKLIVLACIIALIGALFTGCSQNSNEEVKEDVTEKVTEEKPVFKIGAIPDQNASKLNKRFDDLAKHIANETGLEVEYVPTVDYSALVTGFKRNEIQLGWFGGLTGVQARNSVENAKAIAQRPRDEKFHSVFIKQKSLEISKLEDLKDVRFTFGSESSTSGHLMPRHFLIEAGIDPTADFNGEANFSGSHDKTWKLVEAGSFEAGALNEAVWESALENDKVDLSKVEVFYTTPSYYDYNWTINNVDEIYGEGTTEKVQAALLNFGEKNPEVMALFSDEKFIKTNNSNYKAIEDVAKKLQIIK